MVCSRVRLSINELWKIKIEPGKLAKQTHKIIISTIPTYSIPMYSNEIKNSGIT